MDLSLAQLNTLKAAIAADPTLAAIPNNPDGNQLVADAFNVTEATFTVWKPRVSQQEISDSFVDTEMANITALALDRFRTLVSLRPNGFPVSASSRAAMEDIWSGAAGTVTRGIMGNAGTIWRRLATRGEKLFANTASGNGANATPATLTAEGEVTSTNILDARNRP